MTARKKKAVGFGVSAGLFALMAGIFGFTEVTPDWVGNVLSLVAGVSAVFGLTVVVPEE